MTKQIIYTPYKINSIMIVQVHHTWCLQNFRHAQ